MYVRSKTPALSKATGKVYLIGAGPGDPERQGCNVARLKGGDPFVFGRGGEEIEALEAAGIPVEVVSGITAGIAGPAAIGIPVTHRAVARGVTFLTGHTRDGAGPDWAALRATGTTLVIYMGMKRAA